MGRKPAGEGPADAAARREEILRSAATLFATKGVPSTTVRDIAQAAGILPGSLYYHFDSREEIIDAVLSAPLGELVDAYRRVCVDHDDPRRRVRELLVAAFRVFKRYPNESIAYVVDRNYLIGIDRLTYLEERRVEVEQVWLEVVRDGMARGQFRADVDPRLFYEIAAYPIWLSGGIYGRSDRTPESLADERLSVLMDGLAT